MRIYHRIFDNSRNYASFLLSLLICSKILIMIVERYKPIDIPSGLIVMGSIWLLTIIHPMRFRLRIETYNSLFILWIILFVVISLLRTDEHVKDLAADFFEYCLLGYLIGSMNPIAGKTFKCTTLILLIIAVPTILLMRNDISSRWQSNVTMDLSYAIMPPVFAVIAHFLYTKERRGWWVLASYAFAAFITVFLLLKGTRGFALSLLFFGLLWFMNQDKRIGKKISAGRMIVIAILVILVINFETVLNYVNQILSDLNINVNFIQKTLSLISASDNDLTNGRGELFQIALEGFIESPIIGKGIGVFTDLYPELKFPHNIVSQAMFEGGILFGFPIIGLYFYAAYRVLYGKILSFNTRTLCIFLAACTIPVSMLSNEYWVYPLLWVLFGITTSNINTQNDYSALGASDL